MPSRSQAAFAMQLSFAKLKARRALTFALMSAAFVLSVAGCASFQGEGRHLNPVETFPLLAEKKSAQVQLTYIKRINYREQPDYSSFETICRITCMDRIKKSKLLSAASWELTNPDIKIAIRLTKNTEKHESGEEILSPLTLFIFPVTDTEEYSLRATVTDTKTGQQKIIELHDSMTTKSSIVLLPVMFFKFPEIEEMKLLNKLFDNLCIEAYRTGILGAAKPE